MKKFMAVLILFAIVSSAVFAQELKFDGYLNSGLGVVFDNNEDNDPYLKAFGVDGESNGYRFRLNGSYTNEAKNAGAKFRLQSQRRADRGGFFSLAYACGWVGFLDNKINLTGGIIDDSTWATADWWFNDDLAEGLGLLLKVTPIDGLNLGLGAYTITQQTGGSNNILSFGPNYTAPNFQDIKPGLGDVKYTVNVSYTMPDTFRLGLMFRNKNTTMWTTKSHLLDESDANYEDYPYSGDYEPMTLIGELRILAVKDLTAVVVGVFDYLDEFSERGNIRLSETFGYKVNSDLSVGLNAVQFLYNRETGGTKVDFNPGLLFNVWGQYAFGNFVPRLDLVYFMGGQSKMATSATQWERKGFANVASAKDAERDLSVFSVRPSVKINLDGRTFLEIGDMINIDSGNYDGAYADSKDDKKDSRITNVFYIDLKWSF